MAKTRALVQRRRAVRNIRKITRTMELIATARFRKAMDRALEAEAYTRKIAELAADLSANVTTIAHPLLERRERIQKSLMLVICSNRGLCGGYNAAIIREANLRLRELQSENTPVHLELAGKRAITWFRYQGIDADATYTHFEDKPTFDEVNEIASKYIDAYVGGEVDRVEVAYMKFLNAGRQVPVVETLLPLADSGEASNDAEGPGSVDYEFLPDATSILEEVLPMSFKVRLFKCFLDAAVSEQIARRVAMKAATDNADEMIRSITRQYNRARQAQITKEIAEVIGGAEALK